MQIYDPLYIIIIQIIMGSTSTYVRTPSLKSVGFNYKIFAPPKIMTRYNYTSTVINIIILIQIIMGSTYVHHH